MTYWPTQVTWRRWWTLVTHSHMSLLRILEYECLQHIHLEGVTLDVGGGRASDYRHLLSIRDELQVVNLDPHAEPTFIADLNWGIPVAAESYVNVISLNTLEHIWQDVFALQEMARVLRPGGNLYILVPFLYRVHGSPGDYHRHTACFWAEMLERIGFSHESIRIERLNFGPLAAPLSLVEFFLPSWIRMWLRAGVLFISMVWAKLRRTGVGSHGSDTPLGYFISARK